MQSDVSLSKESRRAFDCRREVTWRHRSRGKGMGCAARSRGKRVALLRQRCQRESASRTPCLFSPIKLAFNV